MNGDEADTLVFVYGTLKRGYWNHASWMEGCEFLAHSVTRGRLWLRASLTPILEIPDGHRLLRGSSDPSTDLVNARAIAGAGDRRDTRLDNHGWGWVSGELYRLSDPVKQIRRLDELEEFNPGDPDSCLYDRQLAPVGREGEELAWLYPIPPNRHPEDYRKPKDPFDWKGEVELPQKYFNARQRGESPPPPPIR